MKKLISSLLMVGLASVAFSANARSVAYVNGSNEIYAGPDRSFPVVSRAFGGTVVVYGCLPDYSWCDIRDRNYRGWMRGANLSLVHNGGRYTLGTGWGHSWGPAVISFSLGNYWDVHYPNMVWYRDRDRYRNTFKPHHHRPGRPDVPPPHVIRPGRPHWDNDRRPPHHRPGRPDVPPPHVIRPGRPDMGHDGRPPHHRPGGPDVPPPHVTRPGSPDVPPPHHQRPNRHDMNHGQRPHRERPARERGDGERVSMNVDDIVSKLIAYTSQNNGDYLVAKVDDEEAQKEREARAKRRAQAAAKHKAGERKHQVEEEEERKKKDERKE